MRGGTVAMYWWTRIDEQGKEGVLELSEMIRKKKSSDAVMLPTVCILLFQRSTAKIFRPVQLNCLRLALPLTVVTE